MRLAVCRSFTFDAAHQLPNYAGDCSKLHGHRFELEIEVSGEFDSNKESGMIIDFKSLTILVKEFVVSKLDHSFVNDKIPNPTAENIVRNIVITLQDKLATMDDLSDTLGLLLERVRLYETEKSFCEWKRSDNS
jgi:6-pyruvoyltetrahydropterin/6-carboxytetrahydropterin synthase